MKFADGGGETGLVVGKTSGDLIVEPVGTNVRPALSEEQSVNQSIDTSVLT